MTDATSSNASATAKPAVLYFGNDWNADNRTSSHHIARRLAEQHEVYYLECPGLRAPRGGGRDFRRIVQKLWRSLKGPRQMLPGLKVQTLLQVPLHRFALVRWLNARLIYWSVRWLMWRQGVRRPIAWFVVPHVASLVGRLGESLSVYYCIDDYASLPDVNVNAVRAMDDTLTRKCNLVFVASDTLLEAKAKLNPHTYYSPHGVDVEHFARARGSEGSVPEDVGSLPRPVVGFFGLIERWIDVDLVADLARQRPDWSFLMIGRVALPATDVPQVANLHFIGQRRYEELPRYGRLFSAAIMPFRLTKESWHANPLKLREYLAMGIPVVSVAIPEADKFADVIEIAHGREEFLARLDKVVQQPDSPEAAQRRMDRVASLSWEARFAEVLSRVRESLETNPSRGTGCGERGSRPLTDRSEKQWTR
jgi:glycosyltransferase involved in cell wall biosynthesis